MFKDFSLIRSKKSWLFGSSIFSAAAIFLASQFIPITVLVLFLMFLGRDQEQVTSLLTENHAMQFVVLFLIYAASVFFVYRLLTRQGEKPLRFLMLKRVPTFTEVGEVIVTYGLYFLTLLVATVLVSLFTSIDINQAQELGIVDPGTSTSMLLVFLSLVILPPISEEILFRGFLFQKLQKYSSTIIASVFVSVLFGLAHLEYGNLNWIAVVDTLIFSAFLIYISQRHKSLYSAMMLHAIKNAIAFYVIFVL